MIVLDDFGVDALGCYGVGGDPAPTPNMDALAARGVRFENVWSAPVCSPTRAAIQTGRLGFRTGIGKLVEAGKPDEWALQLSEVTLPEMLDAGTGRRFAHAAFGKWHLGNESVGGWRAPNDAGYDHYSGALLRGPDAYFEWPAIVDGERTTRSGYLPEATVADALAWTRKAREPWFCYLALHAVHAPLHRPPEELCSLQAGDDAEPRDLFHAMVEATDTLLGRLFDELGEELAHTNVILVGDNGTLGSIVPEPFARRAKGTLYEGGIRVPLIAAGPRVAQGGVTCAALVHVADLFATVADLAHVDLATTLPDVELDSLSLLPYLEDPSRSSLREILYSESFEPNGPAPSESRRAARDARFKLIAGANEELFDLARDPFEQANLLPLDEDDPARPAYEALRQLLENPGSSSSR